jgi:choline kinase
MQIVKNAIIAAAGMGKRLGFDMPKPLVQIGDKTLIERQLELLEDVENVYVIVGFRAEDMINHVRKIRNDAIFVMNHDYAHTNTMFSLHLALKHTKGPYIFMDGDVYIPKDEFLRFLHQISPSSKSILGITKSKSEDGVFVEVNDVGQVIEFTREVRKEHEWLGVGYFKNLSFSNIQKKSDVFSHLCKYLPLKGFIFDAYEIDTIQDLEMAQPHII